MKKSLLIIIITICVLTLFGGTLTVALADEVDTDIFSPSSYLEFCELNYPYDYTYDKASDTHVITEAKRIVVYRDNLFSVHDMPAYNINRIKFFDSDNLLFLSDGKLYLINIDGGQVIDSGFVASYFDVLNGYVVTSVGNSFKVLSSKTENGKIIITEKSHYNVEKNYTAIAMISETEWLCVNEGTLFKFNSSGNGSFATIANNLKDTRYACYNDGVYYLTRPNGVYSVDVESGTTDLICASTSEHKLGNVISPQGIAFFNGNLYITDYSLNAVSEFNPETKAFTGYAITSRSDGAGRVSTFTEDLQTYGEKVYALDKNTVKIFSEDKTEYKVLPVNGNFTAFSVIDDKMLITNGNSIYAVKEDQNGMSLINVEADLASFTSVTAITSFADKFYFLNNTIIDSNPYAEVYSLTNFKTLEKVISVQGRGDDICTDIFGKLYLQIYKNSVSSIVSLNVGDTAVKEVYSISGDADRILSLICDFECNVYALQQNNVIVRIDENSAKESYRLSLSQNLPSLSTAKDLTIIPATDKVFALFDGFILSLNPQNLSVSSPEEIKVPEDYDNLLNTNPKTCKLSNSTRYFGVDLDKTAEFYYYTGYSTYNGEEEFVILHSDEKYTLIANENLSCIVRTKDIETVDLATEQDGSTLYLCNNGHLYGYPVLTPYFRSCEVFENDRAEVKWVSTFNGVKFALVKIGDSLGYLPYSMLKTGVAITDTPLSYQTLTVGRKGATVYNDKALTEEKGKLEAFANIIVYEKSDGVYKIDYNGEIGYVEVGSVYKKGNTVIRNLILVSITILAIIITLVFIYRKKYGKKD